jgi:hypothetical protein
MPSGADRERAVRRHLQPVRARIPQSDPRRVLPRSDHVLRLQVRTAGAEARVDLRIQAAILDAFEQRDSGDPFVLATQEKVHDSAAALPRFGLGRRGVEELEPQRRAAQVEDRLAREEIDVQALRLGDEARFGRRLAAIRREDERQGPAERGRCRGERRRGRPKQTEGTHCPYIRRGAGDSLVRRRRAKAFALALRSFFRRL